MSDLADIPTWDIIALNPRYRSLPQEQKDYIKQGYIQYIAPMKYKGFGTNPIVTNNLLQVTRVLNLPKPIRNENQIFDPQAYNDKNIFSMDQMKRIESHPEFKKASYEDQQNLRYIAYQRMSIVDTDFQKLKPEEQQQFYQRWMSSAPALAGAASYLVGPQIDAQAMGDYVRGMNRGARAALDITNHLVHAFGSSYIWPAELVKMVFGNTMGFLGQTMQDGEKMAQWLSAMREGEKTHRLQEGIANFVGMGLSLALPGSPFGAALKILSGAPREIGTIAKMFGMAGKELKEVKAIESAIGPMPGIIEKGARAVGMNLSPFAYRVTGDVLAGAITGIGQNIAEGKKWTEGLAGNIGMGLLFGGAGRYVGQIYALRKATKLAGISPAKLETLLKTPFDPTKPGQLTPELSRIMSGSQTMDKLIKAMAGTDKEGMIFKNLHTPEGLNFQTDLLKIQWKQDGNKVTFHDGEKQIGEATGTSEESARRNAADWLATSTQLEPYRARLNKESATMGGKSATEQFATARKMEMRIGGWIPEQARNYVLDRWGQDLHLPIGRAKIDNIDEILRLVRSKLSPQVVAKRLNDLWGMKIALDQDGRIMKDAAKAEIEEVRTHLNDLYPQGPALRMAGPEESALNVAFSPAIDSNPYITDFVFTGSATQLREHLLRVKQAAMKTGSTISRSATNLGLRGKQLVKFIDSQVVEVRFPLVSPEGTSMTADLHFPSVRGAVKFMQTGNLLEDDFRTGVFFGKKLTEDYANFVDAMRSTPRMISGKMERQQFITERDRSYLPFKFMMLRARQDGYNLGFYEGKYILEDILADAKDAKRMTFDSLEKVYEHLGNNDTRGAYPDLTGKPGLSLDAQISALGHEPDVPLSNIEYAKINRNRNFGIRMMMNMKFSPSQYVYQQMEKMVGSDVLARYGVSPVHFHTELRSMVQTRDSHIYQNGKYIQSLERTMTKKEAPWVKRYMESIISKDEIESMPASVQNHPWELRNEVVALMKDKIGGRTDHIISIADQLSDWYKGMFSAAGLDWNTWIRRYHPHIVANIEKRPMGLARINWDSITALPDANKKEIMELLREADPTKMTYLENPFDAARFYSNMVARKMWTRPIMDNLTSSLRRVIHNIGPKDMSREILAIMNYYKGTLSTLEGIHGDSDRLFEMAIGGSMDRIRENLQKGFARFKSPVDTAELKGMMDMKQQGTIGKLITLAVGGQLAFRGWPVFKQITQAFVTGGSLIGEGWVAHGFNRLMMPGEFNRMRTLGIMRPTTIVPVVGSESITKGLGGKAIRVGMTPFSSLDQLSRGAVYLGMEGRIRTAIEMLQNKQITMDQFINKSGMKIFGPAHFNEAAKYWNTGNVDSFINHLARVATDKSIFLYDRFETATAFRGSFGRLFGQYTHWPINFYTLIKDRLQNLKFAPYESAMYLARLAATSTAIGASLYEVGVNPREFAPWNNIVMSPGPYAGLIMNYFMAMKGDRTATQQVARTLASLVPFAYVGSSLYRAVQAIQDGNLDETLIHLMSAPPRTDIYPNRYNVGISKMTESAIMSIFSKVADTSKSVDFNNLFKEAGI